MQSPPFSMDPTHTPADITCGDVLEMMRQIPVHKQRIAGKFIPIEKFVIAKNIAWTRMLCSFYRLWRFCMCGMVSTPVTESLRNMMAYVWEELMI